MNKENIATSSSGSIKYGKGFRVGWSEAFVIITRPKLYILIIGYMYIVEPTERWDIKNPFLKNLWSIIQWNCTIEINCEMRITGIRECGVLEYLGHSRGLCYPHENEGEKIRLLQPIEDTNLALSHLIWRDRRRVLPTRRWGENEYSMNQRLIGSWILLVYEWNVKLSGYDTRARSSRLRKKHERRWRRWRSKTLNLPSWPKIHEGTKSQKPFSSCKERILRDICSVGRERLFCMEKVRQWNMETYPNRYGIAKPMYIIHTSRDSEMKYPQCLSGIGMTTGMRLGPNNRRYFIEAWMT